MRRLNIISTFIVAGLAVTSARAAGPKPTVKSIGAGVICQCGCNFPVSTCNHEQCSSRDEMKALAEKEIAAGRLLNIVRAYLSEQHRDHADSGCPSAALLPEISRQEPATRHVYTESVKRLLKAVEKQLPDMPKGPKARQIAIGTMGLLIGTLQMARAVDDPRLRDRTPSRVRDRRAARFQLRAAAARGALRR